MPRLFVALALPEALRQHLAALKDPSLAARWPPAERLHLTLRFIGEVSEPAVAEMQAALEAIEAKSFVVAGRGLGVFPSLRRPRVIFASVEASPPLRALVRSIEDRLVALGYPPEPKPFRPHITLARLKAPEVPRVRALLQRYRDYRLEPFAAEAFHLYESRLGAGGAQHLRRATFRLAPG